MVTKVAVCGNSSIEDTDVAKKAFLLGEEIARKGLTLLTGGCNGYPYEAAKGTFSLNGEVVFVSPAKNKDEHKVRYGFPIDNNSEIVYTSKGIPLRNYDLVSMADAVIFIGGKIGSLNEFTLAFYQKKKIGVLLNSGGISLLAEEIANVCDRNKQKENIVYSENVSNLLGSLL